MAHNVEDRDKMFMKLLFRNYIEWSGQGKLQIIQSVNA